ncbi:hypothetical protein ABZ135_23030 [Streptomyces sp. NPDC006339]|uniref:hypothetical protein n=1 Tax=Streptomyces sp. NPDC006339 TaxID=3156755 RepID=UPI0033AFEB81
MTRTDWDFELADCTVDEHGRLITPVLTRSSASSLIRRNTPSSADVILTVGFRLGNDTTTRQVTVLVTQSGVLHRAQGLYGRLARLCRPERSPAVNNPLPWFQGEHPLARPVADLRRHHAAYTRDGYTRIRIRRRSYACTVTKTSP